MKAVKPQQYPKSQKPSEEPALRSGNVLWFGAGRRFGVRSVLRSPLTRLHRTGLRQLVSPHPDPLPRGEGTACVDRLLRGANAANRVHCNSENRSTILPLPWGEGRGEGERSVAYPADLSVRFLIQCFLAFWALLVFWQAAHCAIPSAEPTKAQLDFFENKIRPILADNCYKCHSPARGKVKGDLELDWKGGWEKGGENGPVIVPGDPEKSRLIKAIRYTDPDLQMPPKGEKLSETQISDLVAWVKMSAPDPRTTRPAAAIAGEYGGNSK